MDRYEPHNVFAIMKKPTARIQLPVARDPTSGKITEVMQLEHVEQKQTHVFVHKMVLNVEKSKQNPWTVLATRSGLEVVRNPGNIIIGSNRIQGFVEFAALCCATLDLSEAVLSFEGAVISVRVPKGDSVLIEAFKRGCMQFQEAQRASIFE